MHKRLAEVSDTVLALVTASAGIVAIAIGWLTTAHPFNIAPSVDGVMMMAQLGFVLAVLHGVGFRKALAMMAPVLLILGITAVRQRESTFALVGACLTLYGVLGIAMAMVLHPRDASSANPAGHAQPLR